jgi:hypothetical protein
MPDIIEKQNTARGRLDIDVDLRVGVARQACRRQHRSGFRCSRNHGRSLQQDRPSRIDIGWPTIRNKPIEIGDTPVGQEHNARQGAGIFVNVGILGLRDEGKVARLKRRVDFLDGHANHDETQAEQVGKDRAIRGKER